VEFCSDPRLARWQYSILFTLTTLFRQLCRHQRIARLIKVGTGISVQYIGNLKYLLCLEEQNKSISLRKPSSEHYVQRFQSLPLLSPSSILPKEVSFHRDQRSRTSGGHLGRGQSSLCDGTSGQLSYLKIGKVLPLNHPLHFLG
jgi:hypothetical protein